MNCPNCNHQLTGNEEFCVNCGTAVTPNPTPVSETSFSNFQPNTQSYQAAPNYNEVPPQIKKWNWGAFMFNIIWGIGNHAYLPLLCLIPLFNIIWIFVCGAKGNEWAWKSGKFKNPEELLAVQHTWSRAGLAAFIIYLVIMALYFVVGLFAVLALAGTRMSGGSYF